MNESKINQFNKSNFNWNLSANRTKCILIILEKNIEYILYEIETNVDFYKQKKTTKPLFQSKHSGYGNKNSSHLSSPKMFQKF